MKRSQCTMIKSALRGGPITAMHAFRLCGTMRLAARIHDLRAQGVAIETTIIKAGNARVAQYQFEGWHPDWGLDE